MLKKAAAVTLTAGVLFSGLSVAWNEANAGKPEWAGTGVPPHTNAKKIENVIFMIPDGFNATYATNYRWFKGEKSSFDPYVKGLIQTYSANTEVTDSAAAGTAMATGVKTNNGMVGVTPDGKEVPSILDAAEAADKSTGLVATSTITHATPAVFGASVSARGDEALIAPQYFENGVDVLLGGGRDYFLPASEGGQQPAGNLVETAIEDGYQYVTNRDELLASDGEKILGLFADGGMAPELDRDLTDQPSLAEMTEKAIEALSQDDDGFFLMVEGSQIDWAGHDHDAAWAMNDVKAFDEAVAKALEFAEKDGNTLVVVAGDHETGGMSVGSNGVYDLNIEVLKNVTATGDAMEAQLNDDLSNLEEVVLENAGIELTADEVNRIKNAESPSIAINEVICDRALIGWTSSAHTGTDVPVYAFGPQSDLFVGLHNNTDLPKLIAEAMKIELGNQK
ncbi:alkaline phosphatase [Bacillus litorisediminis]|uniref:alkaline phosphatase n=1 Tax=Bacillus litorisediminis TaxID=2922713 RepID=UPI001FAD5295|nr:alkaline phosphatase [Bacillus litorisediminis]